MRAVFIGAGELTVLTAKQLLERGHEVVIIEKEKARIEELNENMVAGFIHGDGSKPAILREANPSATDFLFALANNDQYNIIASLVGRSLGYKRVITRIEDAAYEHICIELGLEDTIIPSNNTARYLADMCSGQSSLEFTALIKGDARVFSFVASEQEDKVTVGDLDLPANSKVMFMYRNEEFLLPDAETVLKKEDEIMIIAHRDALSALTDRWHPPAGAGNGQPNNTD